MKRLGTSITEGSLFKAVVTYTIPIILSSVLQLLFNAADLIVVGRFCGSASVAAVGATGSLTNLIVNMFIGLSVGASVCVAHAYGANDDRAVHRTVHTAIVVSLVAGFVLTIVGVTFSKSFLMMMDTPENILNLSSVYMKIYFGGIIFSMIYNYSAAILRAVGDTKGPLAFLTIAGVVNVILNLLFVLVFHMNVAGVALATVISQGISAFLVVRSLMHRSDASRLYLRQLKVYKEQLFKMLKIGIPAGIQGSLFSISNVIIQSSVNSFGDVFMSGRAAASSIEGFVYVILNSFSQTAVNFVGQNYGAGNFKRVMHSIWMCMICIMTFGVVCCILTYYFAPHLLKIYITDSPQAIKDGLLCMKYICLPYFLCGLMEITTGAIRGLGASFVTMCISVLGVVGIRLGWIYTIFASHHTPETLLVSYPISWIATFLCQLLAFYIIYKKKTKTLE